MGSQYSITPILHAFRSVEEEGPPVLHGAAGIVFGAVPVSRHGLTPVDGPGAHAVVCKLLVRLQGFRIPELRFVFAAWRFVVMHLSLVSGYR